MVESCFTPIIQSGGDYDIKVSAQSNSKNLKFDVIICSLGARYRNYCGNVTRTFLVDPPQKIAETYSTLIATIDICLEKMVIGNQLKDVMDSAKTFLQRKAPHLLAHLPKNLGFAIGLEFRDGTLLLNNSNTITFKEGMVFNLSVGFHNVPLEAADKMGVSSAADVKSLEKFSLLVADTVCIQKDGVPDILTKADKALSEISYVINSGNVSICVPHLTIFMLCLFRTRRILLMQLREKILLTMAKMPVFADLPEARPTRSLQRKPTSPAKNARRN